MTTGVRIETASNGHYVEIGDKAWVVRTTAELFLLLNRMMPRTFTPDGGPEEVCICIVQNGA